MSHYLVTFLGRVPRGQDGYQAATYRFPDGFTRRTSFSGVAVEAWCAPDAGLVLGTTGSMWHVL
ncbi:MAG: TIGR02221 family CRISPR-associated protein, partial [Thiohalorhabdaceae bacterium]